MGFLQRRRQRVALLFICISAFLGIILLSSQRARNVVLHSERPHFILRKKVENALKTGKLVIQESADHPFETGKVKVQEFILYTGPPAFEAGTVHVESGKIKKQEVLVHTEAPTIEAETVEPESRKNTEPPTIEAETVPPESEKNTEPPTIEAETVPPESEKNTEPPTIEAETVRPESEKNTEPPTIEAETVRPESEKNTEPPTIEAETVPPESEKNTEPPTIEAETVRPESVKVKEKENVLYTEAPKIDAETVQVEPLNISFQNNFVIVDSSNHEIPADNQASFVIVIPRRILRGTNSLEVLNQNDRQSAIFAGSLLSSLKELDGLACLPRSFRKRMQSQSFDPKEGLKGLFNRTWCKFKKRDWSIQIRNNGEIKAFQLKFPDGSSSYQRTISKIQMCDIVNMPFVIKEEAYTHWRGLRHDFGKISLLDFFVRTGGQLRIGKSADCFYSDDLFEIDRGNLNGEGDFPEYSNFGREHGVLRIIMEDRIEWTKCVATDQLCKEEPYTGPPTTLPRIAQPICCSVMLNQILKDSVAVFNKLGIQYRVVFGTLLGGERSGSIIPYTRDIDFTLESRYCEDKESYATLQKHYGSNYFISGHSFIDFPRLIPLMPAHLKITTAPFFKDEYDVEGDSFFSTTIDRTAQQFLPFRGTVWNTRAYADFYESSRRYWNGSSTTVINGATYTTSKDKHFDLVRWYGNDWKNPSARSFSGHSDAQSNGLVYVSRRRK